MPGRAARARRRQAIIEQNLQRAQSQGGNAAAEAVDVDEADDEHAARETAAEVMAEYVVTAFSANDEEEAPVAAADNEAEAASNAPTRPQSVPSTSCLSSTAPLVGRTGDFCLPPMARSAPSAAALEIAS